MTEQLALDLPVEVDFSPESYIASPANQDARAALNRWRDWPDRRMALIGPEGSGKSHLGHIWAWQMEARICTPDTLAATLEELPSGAALVVEALDGALPEQALFHAINRASEADISALLLTGRTPPAQWCAQLPDLVSRLRATPQVALAEPDDEMLTALMQKHLQDRRAPVKEGVIEYLLPRMERSVRAARLIVERMDKRALVKQTPITRAIARETLETWYQTEFEDDLAGS